MLLENSCTNSSLQLKVKEIRTVAKIFHNYYSSSMKTENVAVST